MSASRWVLVSSIFVVTALSTESFAVPFRPAEGEMFSIHSDLRFRCARVNGEWVFGKFTEAKGTFKTFAAEKRSLQAKIAKASGKALTRLRRDLKAMKIAKKEVGDGCSAGPTPEETPTPTPTPFPDALSLLPLSRALTAEDVRYLTEKAGYGFSAREAGLAALAPQGVAAVVNAFMTETPEDQALLDRIVDRFDATLGDGAGPANQETLSGYRQAILERAVGTKNPFLDHFAQFLSGLFTVGCDELVNMGGNNAPQIPLCWEYMSQLSYFARNPDMRQALITLGRHPVMLLYLDNDLNIKGQPNENYAREVMELFSLSPFRVEAGQEFPNYIEERGDGDRTRGDIFRLAKVMTGWRIAQLAGPGGQPVWRAVFSNEDHETGPHPMFEGTTYAFNAENDEQFVNGLIANHPGAAPYYARELLEWYLTPNPPVELVDQLAAVIKANNFNLQVPVRTLLTSTAFYHENYKNSVIKTPLKIAAEFTRTLGLIPNLTGPLNQERGIHIANRTNEIANANGMDFNVTNPPSVFWHSNQKLMAPATLRGNADFLASVLSDTTVQNNNGFTVASALPGAGSTADQVIDFVAGKLGITLNSSQRTQLLFFMNNVPGNNGTFNPVPYNHANTTHQRDKGLVLYFIMGMLPEFALG